MGATSFRSPSPYEAHRMITLQPNDFCLLMVIWPTSDWSHYGLVVLHRLAASFGTFLADILAILKLFEVTILCLSYSTLVQPSITLYCKVERHSLREMIGNRKYFWCKWRMGSVYLCDKMTLFMPPTSSLLFFSLGGDYFKGHGVDRPFLKPRFLHETAENWSSLNE